MKPSPRSPASECLARLVVSGWTEAWHFATQPCQEPRDIARMPRPYAGEHKLIENQKSLSAIIGLLDENKLPEFQAKIVDRASSNNLYDRVAPVEQID